MRAFQFEIEDDSLEFIINHVFLPPKLPQKSEADVGEHNSTLLVLLIRAAKAYQQLISWEAQELWLPAIKMLENFSRLDNPNSLDAGAFRRAVFSMRPGDVLALHIGAQNAGLILQETADSMIFQSFEVLPLTTEVLKPIGKLRCSYPGPAIAVPVEKLGRQSPPYRFLIELSSFLEKMKRDTTLAPNKHSKGASTVTEERESAHPMFITELLTGILRGIGAPAKVKRFEKRIGDEVLWDHARVPWRRSPLWLVVRVALQTTLMNHSNLAEYKLFMIYLMSCILDLAIINGFASDVLFVMNAKLSRRVLKLLNKAEQDGEKLSFQTIVIKEAKRVGLKCAQVLGGRWKMTQINYSRRLKWTPWLLKPDSDTSLSMTTSEPYIKRARAWRLTNARPERKPFEANEQCRLLQRPRVLPTKEAITSAPNGLEKELALADLELWVSDCLDGWMTFVREWARSYIEDECIEEFGSLVQSYLEAGKQQYTGNPERMSIYFLTLMELWIAMDTLVIACYPLLADYSPYFFTDGFLNPLLLVEPSQRERLQRVEEYVKKRKHNSLKDFSGPVDNIFSGTPTRNSFSIRYFDQNPEYWQLQQKILVAAEGRKQAKRVELMTKMKEQEELKELAQSMDCVYFVDHQKGTTRHHFRCHKCQINKEAERIRVEVFEWPLPDDELKSKAVVFELKCPLGFSVWRDITYCILKEVSPSLRPTPASKKGIKPPFEYLRTFDELAGYYNSPRQTEQQVHWASVTKSFLSSHYRYAKLPTDLYSVCVRHSLNYDLFDRSSEQWIQKELGECIIRTECTYTLPEGPYRHLQFALRYSPFSPNQVIAKQSECPPDIQLNEYIAFGLVRPGRRIQWLNMLRELRARTLTFSNEAVNMLFSLCAWQCGPPGDNGGVHREAHIHLQDGPFQRKLLQELHSMLAVIKTNWQEAVTAKMLITLGVQLLMYCDINIYSNSDFRWEIVAFLKQARAACLEWTRDLAAALHNCSDPREIHTMQLRVVHIAAICRETYNVGYEFLPMLLESEEDVADLIECATFIHDNLLTSAKLGPTVRLVLERDRRLAHKIEGYFRAMVVNRGIRLDFSRVWESYDANSCTWRVLDSPNERWIEAHVRTNAGTYQLAHYNILSGRLLVDGLPLGRMPQEYLLHPVYQEILGEKLLDVRPASLPGMEFETKRPLVNNQVAFAMDGQDLVIRAKLGKEIYHLIPKSKLGKDFPARIIDKYVFWLNLRSGRVELRERSRLWEPSQPSQDVHITSPFDSSLGFRHLHPNRYSQLIDVYSETASMIHSVLSPLEYKSHIEIVLGTTKLGGTEVSARLPRLKLDFVVNKKTQELECRQFPQMVVDQDQTLGTFIGLGSKLIVRQGNVRSVMVPHGTVTVTSGRANHQDVDIGTKHKGLDRVRYHIYTIDDTLGRLVGNGSLASHLYKIYLHGVTSSCMPDPLTGRTGTEEALALLRCAATWSFQKLERDGVEVEILKLIAGLSPKRAYYPKHLKCMQQITWNDCLSPLAQHESFDLIVQDVFLHAESFGIFLDGNLDKRYYTPVSDSHLARRASYRNTKFRRDEFVHHVEKHLRTEQEDSLYIARDTEQSQEEGKVYHVARLVDSWTSQLTICPNLLSTFVKWGSLDDQCIELGYDEKLLDLRLADIWLDLQSTLLSSFRQRDTYQLMFTLCTLAYGGSRVESIPLPLIETLLAFATVPSLKELGLPKCTAYELHEGFAPDVELLLKLVSESANDFADSPEADLEQLPLETDKAFAQRRTEIYSTNVQADASDFVRRIVSQWPCQTIHRPPQGLFTHLSVHDVDVVVVRPLFSTWFVNMEFQQYMVRLQSRLNAIDTKGQIPLHYSFKRRENLRISGDTGRLYQALLTRKTPKLTEPNDIFTPGVANNLDELQAPTCVPPGSDRLINDLRSLLKTFSQNSTVKDSSDFRLQYASDLEKSLDALSHSQPKPTLKRLSSEEISSKLTMYESNCSRYFQALSTQIRGALLPTDNESGWMTLNAGLWPQISTVALLQRLAASAFSKLSLEWRAVLVSYATAITMLQRAKRLLRALNQKDGKSDLLRELVNIGHETWDPLENPDWLLMEVESNMLVRSVQAAVAETMIKPPNGKNTIMQLLMGEGKTSVIVPIVATALADSKKLARVVVLKPLCGQMFQTLVQRLGGLVNRRIFYMPFSRKVNLNSLQIKTVHKMLEDCRDMGGILVVQPEHLLSFKLLGLERLHNAERRIPDPKKNPRSRDEEMLIAKLLIDVQIWLKKNSRDILDESDEILNSRHELIYTIGNSKPMDHHPQRWIVVQELLTLVGSVLKKQTPNARAFEIVQSGYSQHGGFDSIRILDLIEGRKLLEEVARRIIGSELPVITFRHWSDEKRALATEFITKPRIKQSKMAAVLTGDSDLDNIILLLRGLIAHNILLFVLHEKRWKVDYGLDLKRSMLAVPYRAKDSPSGQSEFSHPDVALTLTCLSYYYGGLTENQLEVAFRTLLKTDNPTLEYEKWWKAMSCLEDGGLKHLNAVNLEDSMQWTERILPMFRYNKAVIDFYLSTVVFPLEAKEFQHKLSSSGWDIAEKKTHPTTGFSGTNDNKYLLPLSITQHDTEQQRNTNASVLSYLLQPGDNLYIPVKQQNDTRLGTIDLLRHLVRSKGPEIRVLLDVGAQVLELNNEQVASTWLEMMQYQSQVKAAVYFNEDDELTVLTKEGVREPVLISAFAERLDDCLVYLDEAHTRGTDLKLPQFSRAAVTLGPNLTKDRLVQACMRMRKLGSGHSVLFCGPPEIDRELLKVAGMDNRDKVDVRDVIQWSMQQTCHNTRKLVPIWAKQGISYRQRAVAMKGIKLGFPEALLEPEAKTLEEHYGFERSRTALLTSGPLATDPTISKILEQCTKFGVKSSAGAPMLEEQERELCHEIESERETERPPPVEARKHQVTTHLRTFIDSGKLPGYSLRQDAFPPAFDILLKTAAAEHMERGAWPQTVLVTTDFANTVDIKKRDKGMDNYLMLVNWVVSSRTDPSTVIILSPWEVNALLSRIRVSKAITLHMYAPRTTKASPSYHQLDYYTLPPISSHMPLYVPPPSPVLDLLGLFAGELYFHDYAAYERICGFLGLYFRDIPAQKEVWISPDGHVQRAEGRSALGMPHSSFDRSPLPLLRILIGLRRKGQSYLATHVGCMLNGRQLRKEDVDERVVFDVGGHDDWD